jgi:spermidine/putrescine transport system substrate-binding protein
MIQKMKKAHLLLPIDHSKLTTYKYINSRFLNQAFDPGNKYSVPYFWGTLGIVYNDKYIKADQVQHWDDLWNPKFKDDLMLIDSARDVLGFTLISQGKSVNDIKTSDLLAAKGKLDALMPNVKAIVADEIKMYMAQEEAPLAVTYSGEASEMLDQNKHLHYVVPSEGANLWFDNLVIPKTAKHLKAAYAFLNFINEPKNAAQNAEYIGYSTPNTAAEQLLPKSIRDDKQFYPAESTMDHLQVYQDLGQAKTEEYNDLFLEFKMTNR